jgi:methylenetetrahydrofolate--tRNA-(uracil-5-)-methyltransferase
MRPRTQTPAHATGEFAELVCSNSLGSDSPKTAPGLLKSEMRRFGSLILSIADQARVPAGQALAVDRDLFSRAVTARLESEPGIRIIREEVREVPAGGPVVIATGPLTSEALSRSLANLLGEEHLYFFDAAAPIVAGESIEWSQAFWASRYGKGDPDYVNCPLSEDQYEEFWRNLIAADCAHLHEFESVKLFEGCMPVEEMARRGRDTLLFGPMKPVGLTDPRTGRRPYAVVQLRKENVPGSLFNLVGFQTRLTRPEQRRVFRMIPALARAEFVRYGMMHRNTFVNGPEHLMPTLELKAAGGVFLAGQITGVEGYIESAAAGLVAGINAAMLARAESPIQFPRETAIGSLCHYVSTPPRGDFQPMNINFGLLPEPPGHVRKNERRSAQIEMAEQAAAKLERKLSKRC